jgi:long-chain acyl-CoA synthetase
MASDTIISRFMNQATVRPDAPAYHVRTDDGWKPTSWKTYVDEVTTAARALLTLGAGSKQTEGQSCVCILGFNRPEWSIFDVAAMAVGAAPAGIYTTCSPVEVAYIVGHTEASVVLVENHTQWEKIKQERGNLPKLKHVVLMAGADAVDDPMVLTWEAFLAKAAETDAAEVHACVEGLKPDDLGTLIYTSGTTGPPKGVMLSHENLAWTSQNAIEMNDLSPDDCSLSYLPLSHIAEQMFSVHVPATVGSQIYFAESIEKVVDNLKETRPTVLFAVPRIWEKFYTGIGAKLALATGFKAKLVGWAQNTGTAVSALRNEGKEPSGFLAFKYNFFKKKVFTPLREALGLDRAKTCVSGAAPISAEIIKFLASLDIVVHEVYGQSEDTGPTSFNTKGATRFGSVGKKLTGIDVKIAEDGEILVKGPNVFLGYYKEPEATAEALVDGWLHSGDLGKFDEDGYLFITGRKKDIIITAGGKNVAPKNIEAALKDLAVIGEAVVIGDRRKYLSALISLDTDEAETAAKEHGIDLDVLHEHAPLVAAIEAHVGLVNKDLARVEQIKKFKIVRKAFSIEGGELTPTLKVKRKKVNENYSNDIESMYD